jgi:hypothetical protein
MTSPAGHRRPDPIRWGGSSVPRDVADAIRESEENRYPM